MIDLQFYFILLIVNPGFALKQEMGVEKSRCVIHRMKAHYKEINRRRPKEYGIMWLHKMFLIPGLSLYLAMQDELGRQDDTVDKFHRIIWMTRIRDFFRIMAFFINRVRNPYALYLRVLGPKNDFFYPRPLWEKVEVDLENGNGWHNYQCHYYEFFKDEGVPELTKAYCDIDRRLAELFPNLLEFKRKRTLANGDACCDFYYYKK